MSDWDYGRSAGAQFDAQQPSWPDGSTYPYPLPFPLDEAVFDDDGTAREPLRSDRGERAATAPQPAVPPDRPNYPWPPAPYPAWLRAAQVQGEPTDSGDGRKPPGRRRLLPVALVAGAAAVGATAVLTAGSHPGAAHKGGQAAPSVTPSMPVVRASSSPSPQASHSPSPRASKSPSPGAGTGAPLTLAQAQAALAQYTTVNNSANAQRSKTMLAAVETGSSDAIDAGSYQEQQGAGTAPYPPFGPVQATYYIPRDEPADGPRWFVVQVANAFRSNPATVTSDEYLLFIQPTPGGDWKNAIEPYLLASAKAPQVDVGTDGLATAVSPDATGVAVAPGQLPAATAASLDGTAGAGQAAITDPGNLADRADQRFWQATVTGGTVTNTHTAATGADGQEFALRTADGGALVFYTDQAQLTVTPPAGSVLHLNVPGFISTAQSLSQARVSDLEQFAAYDPPAGGGAPRVVADYSGITGSN